MSRVVQYSALAAAKLEAQVDYLIDQGALRAALHLKQRVDDFVIGHLSLYPEVGRRVSDKDFYEIWISKTRIILWYRFTEDALDVIDIWHTSQQRGAEN